MDSTATGDSIEMVLSPTAAKVTGKVSLLEGPLSVALWMFLLELADTVISAALELEPPANVISRV